MTHVDKVYVFYHSTGPNGYSFAALAADGICLSAWVSESESRAQIEAKHPEKVTNYEKHYPNGYEIVWRGGPITPEVMRAQDPGDGGSVEFIEGRLYAEFLRALTV